MGETLFEILWDAAFLAGPIAQLFKSWRRYLQLPQADRAPMLLVRIVLCLLSFTSTIWILLFALVSIAGHSAMARSISNRATPNFIAFNVLLSAALLVTSFFDPAPSPIPVAPRKRLAFGNLAPRFSSPLTGQFMKHLKKTKRPSILAIDRKAECVVQDAEACLAREVLEAFRRSHGIPH